MERKEGRPDKGSGKEGKKDVILQMPLLAGVVTSLLADVGFCLILQGRKGKGLRK